VDAALQLDLVPLVWREVTVEEKLDNPPTDEWFVKLQPCQEMFQRTNTPELDTSHSFHSQEEIQLGSSHTFICVMEAASLASTALRYTQKCGLLSRVFIPDRVTNLILALELSHTLSLMSMLTTWLMMSLGTNSQ
jgi:hypothetical protein